MTYPTSWYMVLMRKRRQPGELAHDAYTMPHKLRLLRVSVSKLPGYRESVLTEGGRDTSFDEAKESTLYHQVAAEFRPLQLTRSGQKQNTSHPSLTSSGTRLQIDSNVNTRLDNICNTHGLLVAKTVNPQKKHMIAMLLPTWKR